MARPIQWCRRRFGLPVSPYALFGWAIVAAALPALPPAGPVGYVYTGAVYTMRWNGSAAPAVYSCARGLPCFLQVSVTLKTALGPNSSGHVTPVAFQFADGARADTLSNQTPGLVADFFFVTDASGNIIHWSVTAFIYDRAHALRTQLMSIHSGSAAAGYDATVYHTCPTCSVQYFARAQGSWRRVAPSPGR